MERLGQRFAREDLAHAYARVCQTTMGRLTWRNWYQAQRTGKPFHDPGVTAYLLTTPTHRYTYPVWRPPTGP